MSMAKRRALRRELAETYGRMVALEKHIASGANLVDDESAPMDRRGLRRNGIFTDALRYGAGRVDKRKARKAEEKAAIAKMRATEARQKASR